MVSLAAPIGAEAIADTPSPIGVPVFNIPEQFIYYLEPPPAPFVPPTFDMTDLDGDGLADLDPTIIANHCKFALDRLAYQFSESTGLKDFICAFATNHQDVEQKIADVLFFRSIDTGYGITLDYIGTNLDQKRNGDDDDTYRRFLNAKGLVIASKGIANEIIAIMTALDNGDDPASIKLNEVFDAAVVCEMTVGAGQHLLGERFAQLLKQTPGSAIRLILEFRERDVDHFTFQEDGGPAPAAGTGWTEDGGAAQGHWYEGV